MVMNNRERIGRAFDLLSEGLLDAVDPVMTQAFGTSDWPARWAAEDAAKYGGAARTMTKRDVQVDHREGLPLQGRAFPRAAGLRLRTAGNPQ